MFELWNAIKLGRDHCDIQIILAPEDKKAFHDRINADGSDARAIDEALANVKSEEADAFSQDDLCRIQTFIRSLPGGFATLDSTIKHHLRRWSALTNTPSIVFTCLSAVSSRPARGKWVQLDTCAKTLRISGGAAGGVGGLCRGA